ncbi:hypothetical protein RHMOL_Rhmol08G0301100 [Rhododendron molle]|uniref:Uncharacterized protein n=1 Tax=Rhododendron molle TaxID=49168 RepID=A0ACC0MV79_RHOML|nr:hypothetical protein RHMOL_Rhmol08G0301100 [Rhododendron molle]
MSSSSSYTNNYLQHNGDERCNCGRTAVMRTSLTVKNPGRRFLGCLNYKVNYLNVFLSYNFSFSNKMRSNYSVQKRNGCNFFIWVDPQTCERGLEYAKIMQGKKEELERQIEDLKMMNKELGIEKQKLEEENDALVVKITELTEINVKLASQTGPRKTTNMMTVIVVVVVIVFVVCVLLSRAKRTHVKKHLYLV